MAPLFLNLWQGKNITVEGHGKGNCLSCGDQEAEREREEEKKRARE
jgi:hypothetical protein